MAATPRESRVNIPIPQQKLVFSLSAGYCAYPGCFLLTVAFATDSDSAVILGEIAHIHSYEDSGPRADLLLSKKDRNMYPNLILLCPTHHTLVDKQENTFTADQLRTWKAALEKRVVSALAAKMPEISFAELELITRNLLAALGSRSIDYVVIAPQQKMDKNGLSLATNAFMTVALARANVVAEFVDQFSRVDPDFADRLRAGFALRYQELRDEGLRGDELFEAMLEFACTSRVDLKSRAAGLAVLGYFFEACEVFEK